MTGSGPNRERRARRLSPREKMRTIMPLLRAAREGREQLVSKIASDLQISARTLWRWLADFEQLGSKAFTKEARSDRGSFHFFRHNLASEFFVAAAFASGVTSPSAIRAAMLREFAPEQVPSLSTIRAYVKAELEVTL